MIVEFTLVLPVLVALFLGVVSYGYDFYTYNRLEEVVRSGARFASTQIYDAYNGADPTPGCTTPPCVIDPGSSAFATAVRNMTVYGTPTPTDTSVALVEGLTVGHVQVLMNVTSGVPTAVGVGIDGYQLRTPMGSITLKKPVTMFYYPAATLYKMPGT